MPRLARKHFKKFLCPAVLQFFQFLVNLHEILDLFTDNFIFFLDHKEVVDYSSQSVESINFFDCLELYINLSIITHCNKYLPLKQQLKLQLYWLTALDKNTVYQHYLEWVLLKHASHI